MRLVVKFPTRGRPRRFLHALDRYVGLRSGAHDVHFVISMDRDDASMHNAGMIALLRRLRRGSGDRIQFAYGASTTKVEACNADLDLVRRLHPDVILLASDDMIPVAAGYDDIIARDMAGHFPDTDGVLHYDDGFLGRDRLITLSILGRRYFERFGYLYHPAYKSVFCDDEFTDVARLLGRAVYVDRCIIQHRWVGIPHVVAARGEAGVPRLVRDALHEKNQSRETYDGDRAVYERRKAGRFGLPVPPHADGGTAAADA
jgi:hypothetical protein